MSLPIVVALIGLVIGTSAIGIMSGVVAVPSIASIVGVMLGLGVGIDYALFILARHRQNLDAGMPVPEAIGRANATAGLSVLFAGVTVMVAIAGLNVSGIPMMAMMGWASAIMVAVVDVRRGHAAARAARHRQAPGQQRSSPVRQAKPAYDPTSASARWTARVVAKPGALRRRGSRSSSRCWPSRCSRCASASPTRATTRRRPTTRKAYDLIAEGYGPGTNGPLGSSSTPRASRRRRDPRQGRDRPRRPARVSPRWTRR